jgi:hypothetical protein
MNDMKGSNFTTFFNYLQVSFITLKKNRPLKDKNRGSSVNKGTFNLYSSVIQLNILLGCTREALLKGKAQHT